MSCFFSFSLEVSFPFGIFELEISPNIHLYCTAERVLRSLLGIFLYFHLQYLDEFTRALSGNCPNPFFAIGVYR